jgi:hypothetical protein
LLTGVGSNELLGSEADQHKRSLRIRKPLAHSNATSTCKPQNANRSVHRRRTKLRADRSHPTELKNKA